MQEEAQDMYGFSILHIKEMEFITLNEPENIRISS